MHSQLRIFEKPINDVQQPLKKGLMRVCDVAYHKKKVPELLPSTENLGYAH